MFAGSNRADGEGNFGQKVGGGKVKTYLKDLLMADSKALGIILYNLFKNSHEFYSDSLK